MKKMVVISGALLLASCGGESREDANYNVDGSWVFYSNDYLNGDGTVEETYYRRGIKQVGETLVVQMCQEFWEKTYYRVDSDYEDNNGRKLIIVSDDKIRLIEGDRESIATRNKVFDFNDAGNLTFTSTLIQDLDTDSGVCVGYQNFTVSEEVLIDISAPYQNGYISVSLNLVDPAYGEWHQVSIEDQVYIISDQFMASFGRESFWIEEGEYRLNIINSVITLEFDFNLADSEDTFSGSAVVEFMSK